VVSANDELSLRIERLERDVRRLVQARALRPEDPVDRLSFRGWLKLSGPTFAVMVFGFGLLWQAQQANTAQLMELSRSTNAQLVELNRTVGRLEGTMNGLQAQIAQLGVAIDKLSERVGRLEAR
jgi:hypothetical protein